MEDVGEQLELFPEIEEQIVLNPLIRFFGTGPQGTKCKTCKHLVINQPGQNKYYKCFKRGITNGAATDHRVGWQSCGKYQEQQSIVGS